MTAASPAKADGPATGSSRAAEADLTDESQRRIIFEKATWLLDNLEAADARLEEDRVAGRRTRVAEKQVEHIESMREKHLESVAKRYQITAAQIEEVLQEGFAKGWPIG